jgi:ssDNA-binding Zn-finger/Zn-ribbon topoisomerase 1
MSDPVTARQLPDRRLTNDRRGYFRGGRRETDWPDTLTEALACPRCHSTEARFVDGTPDTLFWECHACRHPWSTTPQGQVIE